MEKRLVRWAHDGASGLEHLELAVGADGVDADGAVIGSRFGAEYALTYRIRCDARWRVRAVDVALVGGGALALRADGAGHWTDGAGTPLPALDGCVDVDLSASAFTNTLPIRRLGDALAGRQPLRIAYVAAPALTVEPVEQAYTRVAAGRYRYEGLFRKFEAELEVDDDGLVLRYPTLFHRV